MYNGLSQTIYMPYKNERKIVAVLKVQKHLKISEILLASWKVIDSKVKYV